MSTAVRLMNTLQSSCFTVITPHQHNVLRDIKRGWGGGFKIRDTLMKYIEKKL